MLEQILSQGNIKRAFKRVTAKKGAAGVDGVETTELGEVLAEQWPRIKTQILEGSYKPQPVRRVEIDKPGGGVRPLGIPTTTDRLIQQAIGQVLSPIYEPAGYPTGWSIEPAAVQYPAGRAVLEWILMVMNRRIPDRYVRWCERTDRELIPIFLLDFIPTRVIYDRCKML